MTDCEAVLEQLVTYDYDNDIAEQRAALVEFYESTGGAYWGQSLLPAESIAEIQQFEAYLLQLGTLSAASTFNAAYLPASVQAIYEVVAQLSVNCTLQRQLQLVNLLIKYPWNTASKPVAAASSAAASVST